MHYRMKYFYSTLSKDHLIFTTLLMMLILVENYEYTEDEVRMVRRYPKDLKQYGPK